LEVADRFLAVRYSGLSSKSQQIICPVTAFTRSWAAAYWSTSIETQVPPNASVNDHFSILILKNLCAVFQPRRPKLKAVFAANAGDSISISLDSPGRSET
jgi:hypothetical protein